MSYDTTDRDGVEMTTLNAYCNPMALIVTIFIRISAQPRISTHLE